jgi:hypothetical protein
VIFEVEVVTKGATFPKEVVTSPSSGEVLSYAGIPLKTAETVFFPSP